MRAAGCVWQNPTESEETFVLMSTTTTPNPRSAAAGRAGKALLLAALLAPAAAGLGLYVYPHRPVLVWLLLGLCWACYRLRLRALALFGPRDSGAKLP